MIEEVPQKSKESSNVKPNNFEELLANIDPEIIIPYDLKHEPLEFAQSYFKELIEGKSSETVRAEIAQYIQFLVKEQNEFNKDSNDLRSALALFRHELYTRSLQ